MDLECIAFKIQYLAKLYWIEEFLVKSVVDVKI